VSFLSSVVDHILKLHGLEAYLSVGGLAFAEAALLRRSSRYMAHFRQIKWPQVSALIPHHTRLTCDDRYIECPVEA